MTFTCVLCRLTLDGETFHLGQTCTVCQRSYSVCCSCRDEQPAMVRDMATRLKAAWTHDKECVK